MHIRRHISIALSVCLSVAYVRIVVKRCKIGLWPELKTNRNAGLTFRLVPLLTMQLRHLQLHQRGVGFGSEFDIEINDPTVSE